MLAVFVHGVMNPGPSKLLKDVLTLSETDRLQLLWEIWDSLAATPEAIRVTDSQCKELARRHRAHARKPPAAKSREEVRAKLEHRK